MSWLFGILSFVCVFGLATLASAADIYIAGDEIVVRGEIVRGDYEKFVQLFEQQKKSAKLLAPIDTQLKKTRLKKQVPKMVRLISPGGLIGEAIKIGSFIREQKLDTYVPYNQCLSSCALIWLGGKTLFRNPVGRIGFHNAYHPKTKRTSGPGNAIIGVYLSKMGYTYETAHFVTQSSANEMSYVTNGRLVGIRSTSLYLNEKNNEEFIPLPVFRKNFEYDADEIQNVTESEIGYWAVYLYPFVSFGEAERNFTDMPPRVFEETPKDRWKIRRSQFDENGAQQSGYQHYTLVGNATEAHRVCSFIRGFRRKCTVEQITN